MCMFHEGARHLSTWWRENAVEGVQERDLALALVVLPAKERGHNFLDWFARNGSDALWQVRAIRKMALACEAGLMDVIRDLPDERWEWGVQQVLPHLAVAAPTGDGTEPAPSVFHELMASPGLSVDELICVGVLQGVRPRTTCLQWYADNRGESGTGWPIPLLETLAERVFSGTLLNELEQLPPSETRASEALRLLRNAPAQAASCCGGTVKTNVQEKKRDCCA